LDWMEWPATGPSFPEAVRVVPSTDEEARRQKRPTVICICRAEGALWAEAAAAVEREGKPASLLALALCLARC
jgi:hypothetical protein